MKLSTLAFSGFVALASTFGATTAAQAEMSQSSYFGETLQTRMSVSECKNISRSLLHSKGYRRIYSENQTVSASGRDGMIVREGFNLKITCQKGKVLIETSSKTGDAAQLQLEKLSTWFDQEVYVDPTKPIY
jgi:hypothetical protein